MTGGAEEVIGNTLSCGYIGLTTLIPSACFIQQHWDMELDSRAADAWNLVLLCMYRDPNGQSLGRYAPAGRFESANGTSYQQICSLDDDP